MSFYPRCFFRTAWNSVHRYCEARTAPTISTCFVDIRNSIRMERYETHTERYLFCFGSGGPYGFFCLPILLHAFSHLLMRPTVQQFLLIICQTLPGRQSATASAFCAGESVTFPYFFPEGGQSGHCHSHVCLFLRAEAVGIQQVLLNVENDTLSRFLPDILFTRLISL